MMRRTPMGFILFSFLSFTLLLGTKCLSTNNEFSEESPLSYLRSQQGKPLHIKIETLQKWARHGATRFNLDENGLYTVEVLEKEEFFSTMSPSKTPAESEQRAPLLSATAASKKEETSRERFMGLTPGMLVPFTPLKGRTNISHGYWFYGYENVLSIFIAEKIAM